MFPYMPRKSKAFQYHGGVAVIIPKKLADRIGLRKGDEVKVFFDASNEVRVRRVSSDKQKNCENSDNCRPSEASPSSI